MLETKVSIIDFMEYKIRVVETDENSWFVAKDIAQILGIKNNGSFVANLKTEQKQLIKLDTKRGKQTLSCIDKEALIKCIGGCRKVSENVINELCKTLNINIQIIRVERVETAYLQDIIDTLPFSIESIREFKVGKYRIDLYIPQYKIAIECDENEHKGYNQLNEEKRDKFLMHQLQCKFIRFNPHKKDFNVLTVIKEVFTEILSI